ncbi:hypothetical protein ABZ402_37880 [Streptomyces mirabilis]
MYNLTVQQLHTYYVLAGETPVLVHNCGPMDLNFNQIRQRIKNHSWSTTVIPLSRERSSILTSQKRTYLTVS